MRRFPLVLCAILLAGCTAATGPGTHAGEPYIVKSQRALFYSFGPSQTSGPDFALNKGALVTMLSYEYGYSHVAVEGSGETGYVPTEDVAPAPAQPAATPAPAHHRRASREQIMDNQVQAPLPEFPESKPPPGSPPFRY